MTDIKLSTGTAGAVAELAVCVDLLSNGWAVFRSVSPNCFCDLIACKDGMTQYLEVRTGRLGTDGRLHFPRKIQRGVTHFAVFVKATGEVHYIPTILWYDPSKSTSTPPKSV